MVFATGFTVAVPEPFALMALGGTSWAPLITTLKTVSAVKVAVTELAAITETVQPPVPLQPLPDHPAKAEPEVATADSVTDVPDVKLATQVVPQLMPAGEEVTVPPPVPALVTESAKLPGGVCTTWLSAEEVLARYTPLPEYSAVIECVPALRLELEHCAWPEASTMPEQIAVVPSLKVTVPVAVPPLPVTVAVKVTDCPDVDGLVPETSAVVLVSCAVKVAVTVVAALMVTVQPPAPLQPPPDQPVKAEPVVAAAVSVIAEPEVTLVEHVAPQLIPAGDDVTVPVPVPALTTVRVGFTTWLRTEEVLAA